MAAKKDMRRNDLIVPYVASDNAKDTDFQSTMTSTLPMAAIFTRNRLLGWTSVLFALQSWLSETSAQKAVASSPAYFQVLMAVLALGVGYMPLFMPPVAAPQSGTSTGPAAPAP